MKKLCLAVVLAIGASLSLFAQDEVEKAMDAETVERTGLRKLSDSERAALEEFIRKYVAGKERSAAEVAAAQAVDRAVKDRRVRAPDIVQSTIAGSFKGYGYRTTFRLANGQVWKPTNDEIYAHAPIENPMVVIFRDVFGYKMFVEGGPMVRVRRIK